ncbi:xanthine dehydrogenase family protein molybdopterin-binding subunit [Streptomyces sp. NPDC004610]|uniref:xanthine dehydrogenase family protein molybdopterin-binding subunit n=1 Tax=unclassified Streptomyces TaxID=2593676 RepID=UPI0033AC6DFD
MAQNLIGTPVDRVDGRDKVTGTARYAADHVLPRMVYGQLLLSTVSRGTVRAMDVRAARSAPGVVAVYSPFDPLALAPLPGGGAAEAFGELDPPLQSTGVRYRGQIIGLVLAGTVEEARDAATLIEVDYDAQPTDLTFEERLDEAEELGYPPSITLPSAEAVAQAWDASPVTLERTYRQPAEHHNAMEPHAAVAQWDGDTLTLYTGTQGPRLHAIEVAAALGVEVDQVHVVSPHVGGGFGGKATTWSPTLLAAAAARALRRPVKVVVTREQLYTVTGHRAAAVQTVGLGSDRQGRLSVIRHDGYCRGSVTGNGFEAPAMAALRSYKVANVRARNFGLKLNIPPVTIMRAPAEQPGSFGLECALDELAEELGIDPLEIRRRNFADVHPAEGLPWSSNHLEECYRIGAERIGWHRRAAAPGTTEDGDWLVGVGMATSGLGSAPAFSVSVRVAFRRDGTASVASSTADIGTGMRTVLAVMAADALGLPLSRIRTEVGDSTLPSTDSSAAGAIGSEATASVAPAVGPAAQAAVAALIDHAVTHPRSPFRGTAAGELVYRAGVLSGGGRSMRFTELLARTGAPAVEAVATTPEAPAESEVSFQSFSAHFCEVRVNRWTREPRLSRFVSVVDAGRIISHKTARSQIVGGVIWGLGQAFLEDAHLEAGTGRIFNANLADYMVPVNADAPHIDVHLLDHPDTDVSPVGARGLGELGNIGAAAAIANAVHHATGIRVRDLPITIEKLL